jgi:hypothetical protein
MIIVTMVANPRIMERRSPRFPIRTQEARVPGSRGAPEGDMQAADGPSKAGGVVVCLYKENMPGDS